MNNLGYNTSNSDYSSFFEGSYRYQFNGMEADNEVKGSGNSYDFGARMYDSRLGRWLTIDPLASKYPSLSPYNFVGNSPIVFIDPNGAEIKPTNSDALTLLKYLVTPEEAKYIEFNNQGMVDANLLFEGISNMKGKISDNFLDIYTMVQSTDIVEIHIAQKRDYVLGNGQLPSDEGGLAGRGLATVFFPIKDEWLQYGGAEDLSGTISNGRFTYDGFRDFMMSRGHEEASVSGVQGETYFPRDFQFTENDLNVIKKIGEENLKYSNNGNIQVYLSKEVFDGVPAKSVQYGAHEILGHALFGLIKKDALHKISGDIDLNKELSDKIKSAEKNASENYELHNK